MNSKTILLILIGALVVISAALLLLVRQTSGNWICKNGQWVAEGMPVGPAPEQACEDHAVACTQEAKQCPDGSYVSRTGSQCEFAPCPKEDMIQIDNLNAHDVIESPLIIQGKARGSWYFEASFPIKLYDGNNMLLATGIAQAQGDWMSEAFVPFWTELIFDTPATRNGTLVFEKDNPSGLPEHADELRIPVVFGTSVSQDIILYYYNPELDKDETGNVMCTSNGLVAVERVLLRSQTPIQDAVALLLKGELTQDERAQGITTEFPLWGLSLAGAALRDGVLTLEFEDPNNRTVGGSCRVAVLWAQINATATQFPEVNEARFIPEDLFQP